jgi:hypothetical protein
MTTGTRRKEREGMSRALEEERKGRREWRDKRAEINKLGQHRIPGGESDLQLYAMTRMRSKGARVACRTNPSRKARNADNSLPPLPRQRRAGLRWRGSDSRFVAPASRLLEPEEHELNE